MSPGSTELTASVRFCCPASPTSWDKTSVGFLNSRLARTLHCLTESAGGSPFCRDSDSRLLHVERVLIPTLKPGDIVIMDNLASHKGAAIRNALQEAGASLWFLPPYSPDLNPSSRPSPRSSTGCDWPRPETTRTLGATSDSPRHDHTPRMRQLLPKRRICF